MLSSSLTRPRSIVVVGGSNNTAKPGGKILQNLRSGSFEGPIHVVIPKDERVQGIKAHRSLESLPETDLAILAVAAVHCGDAVAFLAGHKNTRGFIILSAGFSEEGEEGARRERAIAETVNRVQGSLVGPNCIGVINRHYQGVFTTPVPRLDPGGCDFISGSGATAVFIMEAGMPNGLSFNSVWSVGNSAQTGVEEVLAHLDETFDPEHSSRVKLLYIENISHPDMLLRHARSLIRKGCRIAAIKAGSSEAGSRAASSHTGALASSDQAVDALFRKSGIIRCYSRAELVAAASVFMHPELKGRNVAVITHAGGPAVMLTDALSEGGLEVPPIGHPGARDLLEQLNPGSSTANPIDFLATGDARQLGVIIDYCEHEFDGIDGMIVIFGSPGLFPVHDVYRLLLEKMKSCRKPIFPVLPSVINAREEVDEFIAAGRINFPDEVVLGRALARVHAGGQPAAEEDNRHLADAAVIGKIMETCGTGYLDPSVVRQLLDAAGIPRAGEWVVETEKELEGVAGEAGYPLVLKVVGPVHKSDVGGVSLGIKNKERLLGEFRRMIKISGVTGILVQPMLEGTELFAGVVREEPFGHLVMCGLGGVFVEALKDVQSSLAPLGMQEAQELISRLKGQRILEGTRGMPGIDRKRYAEILVRLSVLVQAAPQISEMDLNPLLGRPDSIVAVDARICVS